MGSLSIIVDKVQKLWDVWILPVSIMVSLFLQFFLVSFASFRQRCKSSLLLTLIWTAYLLADWVAAFAIGQITQSQGEKESCGGDDSMITKKAFEQEVHAFWASFLLLHLGGPDTITSFALEDNEFWLRHVFGLILQLLAAAYSLYRTFPTNSLWPPTLLVLFVGVIKYAERIRALYLASLDNFGRTTLPKPEPGLDYEEASSIHSSNLVKLPIHGEMIAEKLNSSTTHDPYYSKLDEISRSIKLPEEMKRLKAAHVLFERFKGLIVGFVLTSQDRESSRDYFLHVNHKCAFRVIEYELSFMFKVLHTKVVVLHSSIGYFLRFVSLVFLLSATIYFRLAKMHGFGSLEIFLTKILLAGAFASEIVSIIVLLSSDWTLVLLKDSWTKFVPSFFLKRKRWSRLVFQYDMINYCLRECPLLHKAFNYINVGEIIDKIQIMLFSSSYKVTEDLQEFIFNNLKKKSRGAAGFREAVEACQQRGNSALWESTINNDDDSYMKLKWSIGEFKYTESLLLWHIATEICCPKEQPSTAERKKVWKEYWEILSNSISHLLCCPEKGKKEHCKILSDYMFYLLITQPKMLSPVLGDWHVVFQDTCAEAKRFFKKHSKSNHLEALEKMKSTKVKFRSAAVKGMKSKSVFFDACILAQQLLNLEEKDRRKIMNLVWVEFMFYAAINCTPIVHAQQPSRGGELLTCTWLLMTQLGLGTHFSEQEEQLGTKMAAVK